MRVGEARESGGGKIETTVLEQQLKKTYTTQHQDNQQFNEKMSKGPEKTLLQGGHTDGPETYEKKLNIASHQRDAN